MEVTDKAALTEVEAKQKRMAEMLAKKIKRNPIVGKIVNFKDHIKDKQTNTVIAEVKFDYARSGNKVYSLYNDGWILYKKFKNATKAKKFMRGVK